MKKNKLSVWTWPYRKSVYICKPWRWFRELWINLTNFIHRGRYGFAYSDVWEFASWWPMVGAAALRYFAENGYGYPGCEPWETPEAWKAHLLKLADDLDWCVDSQDILYTDDKNEYKEQMDEINKRCHREEKDENGMWHTWLEMTDADKVIRDKYFEREKELIEQQTEKRIKIFEEIGRNLPRYWD